MVHITRRQRSTLRAFGCNDYGQLGDGTFFTQRSTPITLFEGGGVTQVVCGWVHTMVVMTDGTLRAFGSNQNGQLGNDSSFKENSPVTLFEGGGVAQVACGSSHTMVVMTDGTILI